MSIKYWLYELLGITKKPKEIKRGATQFWYGRVNSWACGKRSVLRKDLDLCVKHGCSGYAIELVGWTDPPETYRTEQYYEKVRKGYEYLVKACRARGLWLFVSVVNDNAGKSGKNPRNPTLDKQKDNVDFAFALVEKWGSRNVVVQPVAEAHNSFAVSLDQAWIPRLKSEGFLTVYNGSFGSPSSTNHGSHYFAVHPAGERREVPGAAFVVSDHSLLLRHLCENGNLSGKGNPANLRAWANHYRAKGNPVVCFYHYNYDGKRGSDEGSIAAMGD